MPRTMNWSRLFGEEGEDVYVRHYHGNEKWTTISPKESKNPSLFHQPYEWPILKNALKKNPELRVYQAEL